MLPEEIYYKFTSPENEATVKLYTDGSKESLGIGPKLSYPKTSLGSHYPMKNILTQFNLHSRYTWFSFTVSVSHTLQARMQL